MTHLILVLWTLVSIQPLFASESDSLADPVHDFLLTPPQTHDAKATQLWATWYRIHTAEEQPSGPELLNEKGAPLGVHLKLKDWCHAAMEGTVRVYRLDGSTTTFNHADLGKRRSDDVAEVDCSHESDFMSISKSDQGILKKARFEVSKFPFGEGYKGGLIPYRSIAVDPKGPMFGKVIFVPKAVGVKFVDADGKTKRHDGYFFGSDTGIGIRQDHIDVFIGDHDGDHLPFRFVGSSKDKKFDAYIVNDQKIEKTFYAVSRVPIGALRQ